MELIDGGKSNGVGEIAKPPFSPRTASSIKFASCKTELYPEFINMLMLETANAVTESGQSLDAEDDFQLAKAIKFSGRKQFGTATDTDTSDPTNPVAIATGFVDLLSHNGISIDFTWAIEENNTVFKTFLIQGCADFGFDLSGTKVHQWQWGGVHSSNGSGVASTTELKIGNGVGNTANLTLTDFGGSVGNLILGSITGIITIADDQVSVSFNATNNIATLNGSTIVAKITTY